MIVNRITGRVVLLMMVGVLVLFVGGHAQAVDQMFTTEGNQEGSTAFGFNPSPSATSGLIFATTNLDATAGPCFTCSNTSSDAGGTTAGSLTDNMDGIIRLNSAANVGQEGRSPALQGQSVPLNRAVPGTNTTPPTRVPNDASAFTVVVDTPSLDFLDAGTSVPSPLPTNGFDNPDGTLGPALGSVGEAGMRMDFSTSFSFRPVDPSDSTKVLASSSTQTVEQATFTGLQGDNSVQLVRFVDSFISPTESILLIDAGVDATITWSQDIKEGGFQLLNNTGDFVYNESDFPLAAAPTGPGQTAGTSPTCIGNSGSC